MSKGRAKEAGMFRSATISMYFHYKVSEKGLRCVILTSVVSSSALFKREC